MARIAIIGWGSLIWDLDDLAPHVTGPWRMRAGPALPMEFTRVSAKRKMGLAVCLDATFGAECPTHVIASARADIGDAHLDLARRERAAPENIGHLCLRTGREGSSSAPIAARIRDWAVAEGWEGALWTDLGSNFADHLGHAFSVTAAIAYLRTLTGANLEEAVRYIENAPETTDTPLRRALTAIPWWQAEAARMRALTPAPLAPGSQSG